ncbi:MAG TPA: tetratricopeptide repeat protein [Candidatus Limnocylindrales bacterium]|nr:tetratricopeptide repeat protein [Candidatus Limnocylindrales bacterium]
MLKWFENKYLSILLLLFAVALLTGCGAVLGPNSRTVFLETGEDYLVSGDYDQAIKTFDSILTDNPKDVKALVGSGIAYYQQGKYEKALEKLTRAKELDPDDEQARLYLGLTYLKKGEDQKALAEWKEYTELISTGKFTDLVRRAIAILSKENVTLEERDFVVSSIEYATQQERKVLVQDLGVGGGSSYSIGSSTLGYPPFGIFNYNYGYGSALQPVPSNTYIIIRTTPSPTRTNIRGGIETRIRTLQGK